MSDHPTSPSYEGPGISIRDRLDGCGLYVGRQLDGKSWRAFLFPNHFEPPIEGEIADDPVSAVIRLARKLQELPIEPAPLCAPQTSV